MKLSAQQILSLAGTLVNLVEEGKVDFEGVLAFFKSSGADAAQLAANRALLVGDVVAIDQTLSTDNQQ